MKPQSAKAKGRNLQKHLRDTILGVFKSLQPDDVRSTSMGASGEDVLLSPAARNLLPCSFECKNRAKVAVYKDYDQAKQNAKHFEPVLVIKQNNSKPLAVVDLNYFIGLHYGNPQLVAAKKETE